MVVGEQDSHRSRAVRICGAAGCPNLPRGEMRWAGRGPGTSRMPEVVALRHHGFHPDGRSLEPLDTRQLTRLRPTLTPPAAANRARRRPAVCGTGPTAVAVFRCRSASTLSGSTGSPPTHDVCASVPSHAGHLLCVPARGARERRTAIGPGSDPRGLRGRRRRAAARHACAGGREVDWVSDQCVRRHRARRRPSRAALARPAAAAPAPGDRSLSAVAPGMGARRHRRLRRLRRAQGRRRAGRAVARPGSTRGPSARSRGSNATASTGTCSPTTPGRAQARSASS